MNDTVHFEKTLSSETLFEGRVITLTKDTALLENGKTATREVVHHHGGACILPYFADGTICMVRQFRYAMQQQLWELPAGKLEKGEDPFAAAKRELEEECGLTADNYISLGEFYPTVGYDTEVIYTWVATGLHETKMHLDADEFLTPDRVPLEKAYQMVLSNEIKDGKTIAGILKLKALLAEAEKRGVPVTTVVQNYNPRRTSVVLGEDEKVLYGKGFILDTLCGKTYALSPRSFYQVNPVQTAVLYGLAVDAAHLTGKEVVLDAYCGIGTIGLTASDKARQVVGVEVNRDAVRDAIGNAKHNGVKNARFFAADATAWIREAADAGQKADVVFMDPPREGSTPAFIESVARMAPKRIVYVSCNPETMARDLALLTQKGYRAEGFTPVDMFPHSAHCEVVGSLVRVK